MDDFKQHPPNSNQIDTEHHRPDFLHPETEPIHKDDGDSIHNSERELARKRKQEKAEVRKKFLKIGGVVAIVLLGLFNLPIPLGSIKVIGSDKVTVQDVEVAGDIGEPVNVLRINRENLRHRLSKDLRIEDAQIGYELPLTMVVRVVERKAIAVISAQFGYLTLDKNGQVIASDSVIEDTTVPMISGVKGGNILLGDMVTDKPIVQALDYLRALDVSGIQIRLGDGEDLKSKADLTASMLKDLPKSQGNVQYIDVNPSSPFIKTDKVTVQPKSNKSKSDTSQSEKKDTSKQSANVSKSKQD